MKLSILICSVHTRRSTFLPRILDQVYGQYEALTEAEQAQVEILVLTDNKKMMLGTKRNHLVEIAAGEYVIFIDDDDRIADNYISRILESTQYGDDCIVFTVMVDYAGEHQRPCYYSIFYTGDKNFPDHYERLPNHIMAIKREIALKVPYPAIPYGEDSGFSKEVIKYLKSQSRIPEVLYFYDYDPATTETQQHINRPKKARRR